MMSLDVIHHNRSIYTLLDFLGDCGGLKDALTVICEILLFVFTSISGSGLESYLLANLFKYPSKGRKVTTLDNITDKESLKATAKQDLTSI